MRKWRDVITIKNLPKHFLGNLQEPSLSPPPIRLFKCVLSNYTILYEMFGQTNKQNNTKKPCLKSCS